MDYRKDYYQLIDYAKKRITKKDQYYEKHHILPKSLGGTNKEDNIVLLTAREHYIAHYLLWKFTNTNQMTMAFWRMNFQINRNASKNIKILSSRMFERLRAQASNFSKENSFKRQVYCLELDKTFESIRQASLELTGTSKRQGDISNVCRKKLKTSIEKNGQHLHWCYIEDKEEFLKDKENMLYESSNLRKLSAEKISKKAKERYAKGLIAPFKGKHLSEQTKEKLREKAKERYANGTMTSTKGKHLSEEARKSISDKIKERYAKGLVAPFKGKHLSEQTKEKLRDKKEKQVYCIELDMSFQSERKAAEFLGKSKTWGSCIGKVCNGNAKYAGKKDGRQLHWIWKAN